MCGTWKYIEILNAIRFSYVKYEVDEKQISHVLFFFFRQVWRLKTVLWESLVSDFSNLDKINTCLWKF